MRFFNKLLGVIILAGIALGVVGTAFLLSLSLSTLPDHQKLADYKPNVSSSVYSAEGKQIGSFALETRAYMPLEKIPNHVIAAFMAAEDKDFYTHKGVDPMGIARAIVHNIASIGEGRRMQGASTITQQVAENVLIPDGNQKRGLDRYISKIQEALISVRIEEILTKDQIMEIYLNQIFLGFRSYGVEAASQTYFQKSVRDVSISQAAYLGTLPKAPNNYNPLKHPERALERRNWVISRMVANGFITAQQGNEAKLDPVDYQPRPRGSWTDSEAGEFVEEVRRDLIRRFGKGAPYNKGFIISTTVELEAQKAARAALQAGLDRMNPNRMRGFKGAVGMFNIDGQWKDKLGRAKYWRPDPSAKLAVVLENGQNYGLQSGEKFLIPQADKDWAYRSGKPLGDGQIVWVNRLDAKTYQLMRSQNLQGALVSLNVHTGAVIAMAGGYDADDSGFNRATQAKRQVGSTVKPFIYAAALENGMTPETKISDSKITGGGWGPENSDRRYYGVITLKQGLVLSRNTVTVRIARRIGMRRIADYARRFGVYDDLPNDLTMALGAGETTVLRMTAGFAVFPNGGRYVPPVYFDRLQDMRGKTVWRADRRTCSDCDIAFDPNAQPPHIEPNGTQVISPRTAWEMVTIMREVVTNGTGRSAQFNHPVAGKTGTTNDYKDAWFIGYTPSYATGVYVGYDRPKTIAGGAAGGVVSAPIFRSYMEAMLKDKPIEQFVPTKEVLDEIGAEERLNILADLQSNSARSAMKKVTSNATTGKTKTSAVAADEVIE
jgi:penicillin-binding protein 1A